MDQAYALGKHAVELALAGNNAVMPIVVRTNHSLYQWNIDSVPLSEVANVEKKLPQNYISEDGYGITELCRQYLLPLIAGEAYPPFENGLPQYIYLPLNIVEKKLGELSKAF